MGGERNEDSMRKRTFFLIVVVNILITMGVAYAVITLSSQPEAGTSGQPLVITVPVLVTATTDPNAGPVVRIITATPLPGSISALPTGILETPQPDTANPTLEAEAQGVQPGDENTVLATTALPANCIIHTVEANDTPFGIAEIYGVSGFDLMAVNGLDEASATSLQIGDQLIVPLEGCELTRQEVFPEPTTEAVQVEPTNETASEAEVTATVRPTLTLPPTASSAQVEIVEVISPGDVTAEGVSIRNAGNMVNMNGWTLTDADGTEYTFGERLLFSNGRIVLYTRIGQDTPAVLFWNRSTAVLGEPGDVLTLRDANGVVQSTYRLPE
ncbi:MAG: lamin tail domain-containing protein [Anaerolineaceae bacterium]|nr:lamin tail domain-containing protein [Anaerolineaceae bacterium]